ncbi:MAG TPA: hypothetical protein VGR67_15975 [Candidatus Polarisedimenticolia bacterium]|jgi:hypothetical protein|nr:hypothetical protein [Candidatus Polarisedimenticolia bacterium]
MDRALSYEVERMGPDLRSEVERQLLNDLLPYGLTPSGLAIDWSQSCQEGHCTSLADAMLESLSGVRVLNTAGEVQAEGWMDFVHGGEPNPLFVFWLFLTVQSAGRAVRVKGEPTIPPHVWSLLPIASRDNCTAEGRYDATWAKDPLVVAWKGERAR